MNRKGIVWVAWMAWLLSAATLWAQTRYVQIREGALRDQPSFLSAVSAQVAYGEAVSLTQERGPWQLVTKGDISGWIHESALSKKRLALASGDQDATAVASHDKLALAGKGFSQQVEDQYRKENPTLNFAAVDRMEKYGQTEEALGYFLRQGGVHPREDVP